MAARRESIMLLRARVGELASAELASLGRDRRAGVRARAAQELRRRAAAAAEATRLTTMLAHESRLWGRGLTRVAGVDEAGAGPLAGPVIAAAVILPPGTRIPEVDDSKRLSARQRQRLAGVIRAEALCYGVGSASPEEIAGLNIYQASLLAMRRAVAALVPAPEHLLVDARCVPEVEAPQTKLVHGDRRSLSIAAASILAKVHRDALMDEMAALYPGYGFEKQHGYRTAPHISRH